jgi:hypothetical protein
MTTYVGAYDEDRGYVVAEEFTFVDGYTVTDFSGILVNGVVIDWGVNAPGDENIADETATVILYKNGSADDRTAVVAVSSGPYANIKWYLDGADVSGIAAGGAYTLDVAFLFVGSHTLTITAETGTGASGAAKSWSNHLSVIVLAQKLPPLTQDTFEDTLNGISDPGTYIFELGEAVELGNTVQLDVPGANIILNGKGYTVTQGCDDSIFLLRDGATLTLRDITLQGDSAYTGSGVIVFTDGTFIMEAGAEIRGFKAAFGAGVRIEEGYFRMAGGVIAGNTAVDVTGGGVDVYGAGARFEKTGGTIYGDDGTANANTTVSAHGNAVLVRDGDNVLPYRDDTVTGPLSVTLKENGNVATISPGWEGWDYGGGGTGDGPDAEAFLNAVNDAEIPDDLLALFTRDNLGIFMGTEYWDYFNSHFGDDGWETVAETVFVGRGTGYMNIAALQAALETAINAVLDGGHGGGGIGDGPDAEAFLADVNGARSAGDVLDLLTEEKLGAFFGPGFWASVNPQLGAGGWETVAETVFADKPYGDIDSLVGALVGAINAVLGGGTGGGEIEAFLNGVNEAARADDVLALLTQENIGLLFGPVYWDSVNPQLGAGGWVTVAAEVFAGRGTGYMNIEALQAALGTAINAVLGGGHGGGGTGDGPDAEAFLNAVNTAHSAEALLALFTAETLDAFKGPGFWEYLDSKLDGDGWLAVATLVYNGGAGYATLDSLDEAFEQAFNVVVFGSFLAPVNAAGSAIDMLVPVKGIIDIIFGEDAQYMPPEFSELVAAAVYANRPGGGYANIGALVYAIEEAMDAVGNGGDHGDGTGDGGKPGGDDPGNGTGDNGTGVGGTDGGSASGGDRG